MPIAQDETGPVGASPKGPGETQPSSSVPTGPLGTLGGGSGRRGQGKQMAMGFSFSFTKQKGGAVLTLVNMGRCGGRSALRSRAAAEAEGQMRLAAFSCTLYSLFFFTRQLMKISSTAPRAL